MLFRKRFIVGIPTDPVAWSVRQPRELADEQLAELMSRNDDRALAQIYDRYARLVFSLAFKILRDRASAEEVVQDVFTQVWRHSREFEPSRGRFSAWLMRITHNRCIDQLRRRRCRPMGETMESERMIEMAADDDPAGEAQLAFERARVRRALANLPSEQRTAIQLAYFEGLTQSEIATRCRAPLGTVKTRIRLGMIKLKEILADVRAN